MNQESHRSNYKAKYDKVVNRHQEDIRKNFDSFIPPEVYEQIREYFNLQIDYSKSLTNTIQPSALVKQFKDLEMDKRYYPIYAAIQSLDTKENRTGVTFEQFMESIVAYFAQRDSSEGIKCIFRLFTNSKKDDFMTPNDLRRML